VQIDNNLVGQSGEAAVAAELAAAGFHVFVPIFCNPENDLIAEMDGKLIRVQVKTLAADTPYLRFLVQTAARSGYCGVTDWIAFHSLHYGVTAFLKPEEVGVRPTLWFDGDQEIKNARHASDYPLGRVIKEILA
jgi:hypothetical protein